MVISSWGDLGAGKKTETILYAFNNKFNCIKRLF